MRSSEEISLQECVIWRTKRRARIESGTIGEEAKTKHQCCVEGKRLTIELVETRSTHVEAPLGASNPVTFL